ncbi:hypothetical protein [Actinocrispum wychmicini]|uniref:Uncharacterized protein n=1 Tax=Actinocrispum wychmicini TaxID=1213861 RepID=A0A4R2J0C4_9PSEU|nr:hypothetical protein [Actinocrispum wychmicini]TCO49649.1 hypothetical protein EV192_11414 [Actinocrispum wychmicini]
MPTNEEIERRIQEVDAPRSAKRAATAQQVHELAQRRAAVAAELNDIERHLGDVLAAATDVIDIDELARFTDIRTADLTQWRAARKPTRTTRKQSTDSKPDVKNTTTDRSAAPRTATADRASTLPEVAIPRPAEVPTRVPTEATR